MNKATRLILLSGAELPAIIFLIGLAGSGWGTATAADPDAATIIARSMAANERDWAAAPSYSYEENVRNDDGARTYEVVILAGTPYKRLTSVNGSPLTGDEKKKEDEKLARERARRETESRDARAQRLQEYERTRDRVHRILVEMPRAFEYQLAATRRVSSRKVYVLRATPQPAYDPPNAEAEVLTGMSGEFWIDAGTYQWVRAFAHVLHPVEIDGFLAKVQPGTEFEVEQMHVDGGVWLPRHLEIRSRASIFFLFPHHSFEDHTYSNYRKSPAL